MKVTVIVFIGMVMTSAKASVLIEGDILVEPDYVQAEINQMENVLNSIDGMDNNQRAKRATTVKKNRIWNFGIIPYEINPDSRFSIRQQAQFKEAMRHWEANKILSVSRI